MNIDNSNIENARGHIVTQIKHLTIAAVCLIGLIVIVLAI